MKQHSADRQLRPIGFIRHPVNLDVVVNPLVNFRKLVVRSSEMPVRKAV